MADIIDEANELELLHIAAALASRKTESLQFIGRCHYCEDPLLNGNFCDSDCRDDRNQWPLQKSLLRWLSQSNMEKRLTEIRHTTS